MLKLSRRRVKIYLFKNCESELTDNYVLENSNKLIKVLRVTNVTVRWLILHRTTSNKKLQELISAKLK